MSILFICPCGKTLRVRAESSGRKVKCPGCGTVQRCPPPAPKGLPVPESHQGSGLARPAGTPLPSALVTRSQASPSPESSKSGSPDETQTFAPPDKPPTQKLPRALGPYRVEGILGRGAFGIVYRAHRRNDRDTPVALKVVEKRGTVDQLLLEPALLSQLDHPCIVGIQDYFVSGTNLVLALEYVKGGDLKTALNEGRTFSQSEVR
jgi:hypothetical protein